MKPCLVLDTSVWLMRSTLGLGTPLAASLLFSLRRREGVLGLPEVLENELRKQLSRKAVEQARQLEEAQTSLDHLGVRAKDDPPFDDEAIANAAVERIEKLSDLLFRISFSEAHARGALKRVEEGMPPNGPKNQQFKDSAIGEAILELGRTFNVTFVTAEKGFFEERNPARGIARNLRAEVKAMSPRRIAVIHSDDIPTLLQEFRRDLPRLDEEHLLRKVWGEAEPLVRTDAQEHGFTLRGEVTGSASAYVTSEPATLSVLFPFSVGIVGVEERSEGKTGKLPVEGQANMHVDEDTVDRVQLTSEWANFEHSAESWTPVFLIEPPESPKAAGDPLGFLPVTLPLGGDD